MKNQIKVDIVSDVVCPWCYIGKRRLELAIAQLENEIDFKVDYIPFELNPGSENSNQNEGGENEVKEENLQPDCS